MKPKCQCKPGCRFAADAGHPYALRHDPRPERQEARHAAMAAAGARGAKVRGERRLAQQVTECSLRSPDALFPVLERSLIMVLNSAADAVDKSREVRGIVAAAAELLKANALAEENAELRRALATHAPQVAQRLKAVR